MTAAPGGGGKRHLPVLQQRGSGAPRQSIERSEDEEPQRPPWHWAAIGAVAVLLAWLPLAMLVEAHLKGQLPPDGRPQSSSGGAWLWLGVQWIGLRLAALAIAAFLGGLLVGRFGGGAGKKEATAAGIGAVGVALTVTWLGGVGRLGGVLGSLLSAVVLLLLAALCARWGASIGLRMRR